MHAIRLWRTSSDHAPCRSLIEDAVRGLLLAFKEGKLPEAMTDRRYYNIKTMQSVGMK